MMTMVGVTMTTGVMMKRTMTGKTWYLI